MKNSDDNTLIELLCSLGEIQKTFDKKKIILNEVAIIKKSFSNCKIINGYLGNEVAVSMSIDSNLVEIIGDDLHSVGMSFTIFKAKDNKWMYNCELGFSSYQYGFEEEYSFDKEYDNIDFLLRDLNKRVSNLADMYLDLISKIKNNTPR